MVIGFPNPVDTGHKLNVHKTSWTSSERLIYVQFMSCFYESCIERFKYLYISVVRLQNMFFTIYG